jgi:uncharacterized protein YcbK (DUF882 family)
MPQPAWGLRRGGANGALFQCLQLRWRSATIARMLRARVPFTVHYARELCAVAALSLTLKEAPASAQSGALAPPQSAPTVRLVELAARSAEVRVGVGAFTLRALNTGEVLLVEMGEAGHAAAPTMLLVSRLMRCTRTEREHPIAPALVDILYALAREGQGTVELVSGYRAPTWARDHNFHTRGFAADVRVVGLAYPDLVRAARKLNVPGLGVYPASKMVHVDVREVPYAWVDYSGPAHGPKQ